MSDYSRGTSTPGSMEGQVTDRATASTTDRTAPKTRRPILLKSSGLVDPFKQENKTTIVDAINDLKSESILPDFLETADMSFLSETALSGIGFTIVETEELTTTGGSLRDFTLINTKNDESTIKNSKIIDPDIKSVTPEKSKPIDKFKSETDKFYEIDDERPTKIKEEVKILSTVADKRKKVMVAKKIIPKVRRSKNVHLPKLSRVRRTK
tara:strand:+ start:197 stop:826 length:630 start_codon:yes stop_codon:yes gene_type:complete